MVIRRIAGPCSATSRDTACLRRSVTPLRVLEYVPHGSMLQFGSLNHGRCDAINSEPACPKLPADRTYGRHRGIDANDPKRPNGLMAAGEEIKREYPSIRGRRAGGNGSPRRPRCGLELKSSGDGYNHHRLHWSIRYQPPAPAAWLGSPPDGRSASPWLGGRPAGPEPSSAVT